MNRKHLNIECSVKISNIVTNESGRNCVHNEMKCTLIDVFIFKDRSFFSRKNPIPTEIKTQLQIGIVSLPVKTFATSYMNSQSVCRNRSSAILPYKGQRQGKFHTLSVQVVHYD